MFRQRKLEGTCTLVTMSSPSPTSSPAATGSFLADPLFWTIVGVVVGVLALYVGFRALRKQFPKRELRYSVQAVPLLSANVAEVHNVQVLVSGRPLRNPHALRVVIESRSRADIPSSAFDAGAPVVIRSDIPMHLSAESESGKNTVGLAATWTGDDGPRAVEVPPQLIRPKASGFFTAVTEGEPKITIESSLIDIAVKYGVPSVKKSALVLPGISAGAGMLIIILSSLWNGLGTR